MLNEALVRELDPEFEVLPVARGMLAPILEREVSDRLARMRHELPGIVEDYAGLVRELPDLIRRWVEQSSELLERSRPSDAHPGGDQD